MTLRPALLLFLCTGCTMIDMHTPPPHDWPEMKIVVNRVSFLEAQRQCGGNIILYITPACAKIDMWTKTCTVYTSTDDENALEHEITHCKGYDHVGSTKLADWWAQWRAFMQTPEWIEYQRKLEIWEREQKATK